MDINPKGQKVIPQAVEAERSVLGCMLLDKDATLKVADFLEADDFYHDHHKFVYEVCLELFHRAEPIDIVTVATKLEARDQLKLIGGPEFLAELQNSVPVTTHIFQYAQLIKHRSTLRKLITAGNRITGLGYESEKKMEELLEKAEKELFSLSQTFLKNRFISIKEVLSSSYERFSEIHDKPELANTNRIPTHFKDLDSKLNGGFNRSDLVILAARPSMGKTALRSSPGWWLSTRSSRVWTRRSSRPESMFSRTVSRMKGRYSVWVRMRTRAEGV